MYRQRPPTVRFACIAGIILRYREPPQWAIKRHMHCSRIFTLLDDLVGSREKGLRHA
jgi:hypothetical protein